MSSVGGFSSKPCSTLVTEGAEAEFGATEMSAEGPETPGVEDAGGAGVPTRRRIGVMGGLRRLQRSQQKEQHAGQMRMTLRAEAVGCLGRLIHFVEK